MDVKTLQAMAPWEWPEGAGALLLQILRDPGAGEEDRRIAAELAGDYTVVDDDLARSLVAIVADAGEGEELRTTAAISLGPALEHGDTFGFEDPDDVVLTEEVFREVQRVLHEAWLDRDASELVRRRVLEASVRAPQGWHEEAVRAAWAGGEPEWRLTAVFCARFLQGFDREILEALESPRPEVRREALLAAGVWQIDAAWPRVVAALADEDRWVRLAAVEATAYIRPERAEEFLTPLLDGDDEEVGEAAAEALGMAEAFLDEGEEDEDLLH